MTTHKTRARKAPMSSSRKAGVETVKQRDRRQVEELDMPENNRMAPERDLPTDDPDIMGGTVP